MGEGRVEVGNRKTRRIHVVPLFHLADAWIVTWVGGTHVLVRKCDPKVMLEMIERGEATLTISHPHRA